MKWLLDKTMSFLALVVLSPLLLTVMAILKLTGEHLVFYLPDRMGKGGAFGMLKFVTMVSNSQSIGTKDITTRDDPRVLPVGKLLRKTKINEIPQIINVLKGDMSLIGPRPVTPNHFSFYSEQVQEIIGRMRPGLSGVGSIVFRDEESIIANSGMDPKEFYKQHIAPYKGELEVWYYNNRSFFLDLKLIVLTLLFVLKPDLDIHKLLKGLPERPEELKQK